MKGSHLTELHNAGSTCYSNSPICFSSTQWITQTKEDKRRHKRITRYPRYPDKHGMSLCALAESSSCAKNRSRHLVLPIKLTDSHKERHLSWDHPQGWLEYLFQSRLWWLLVVSLWLVVAVGGWRCVRVDSQRRLPATPFQKLR